MLSSILQQRDCNSTENPHRLYAPDPVDLPELPIIEIDVACMPRNGEPCTEALSYIFQGKGLNIKANIFNDRDEFAYRGLVRNQQIQNAREANADWVFFADADNVYSPYFFALLRGELDKMPRERRCIFSREKFHTEPAYTQEMVKMCMFQTVVGDAYRRALKFDRVTKGNKNVAAGCMQVVSMKALAEVDYLYVDPVTCRDRHLFDSGQKARSDLQFRKRMGGCVNVELPVQVHLNHQRDKEEGRHLEVQR